jgi:hypothetical protein
MHLSGAIGGLFFVTALLMLAITPRSFGQTRPLVITASSTNVTARYITNVIQVSMPTNIFVNEYHTNWIRQEVANPVQQFRTNWVTRYETNFIDRYRTNLVPFTQTNMLTATRYMTNTVTAYTTNFQNVTLTNWQKVMLIRTNTQMAYNTNVNTVMVTNWHDVVLNRTNAVTAFHTNHHTITETNWETVVVNRTNTVTKPVTKFVDYTNTVAVENIRTNFIVAFQTNFARAFQTNLRTLTLTNWEPVLVMRTNWVSRTVTNFVDVNMPTPGSTAASPAHAATGPVAADDDSQGVSASQLASKLEFNLSHIGVPNRPGQFPVSLVLMGPAGPLPVHEWRVEKVDGTAMVGGTRSEFTGTLSAGIYRVTARVRTTGGTIQSIRGNTEVKADASESRTPANGSVAAVAR